MTSHSSPSTQTHAHRPAKTPNLLVIASGKGGVGKTFVSATLAHSLAFDGRRVLLFDGDLGLANIDVQLGLMPPHDLGSVIAGKVELKDAICSLNASRDDEDGKTHQADFHILAGKSGSGALNALSDSELSGLIRGLISLSEQYDFIIVDLPAGIDKAVTRLSLQGEHVFVVLTDEPTSLTDAYAYIKVVARHDPKAKFQIIVNQVTSKVEGQRTFASLAKACRNFLNVDPQLAGFIRRDAKVKEAIRQQVPILSRSPDSQAAADIGRIAQRIVLQSRG